MLRGAFLHQMPHAFAGIALFLLVKEVIRYVEDNSNGAYSWSHGHHHHHHKSSEKLKDDDDDDVNHVLQSQSPKETEEEVSDEVSDNSFNRDNFMENENLLFKASLWGRYPGQSSMIELS